jgi:hypothetical protein
MEELLINLLAIGVEKYPILMTVFFVIGFLRAINKPLFTFLGTLVKATPTPKDDEILQTVETSKIYKAIVFVLDWTASVKIPAKAVVVPALPPGAAPIESKDQKAPVVAP